MARPGQVLTGFTALPMFTTYKPKSQVFIVAFLTLLTLCFGCAGLALQPEDTWQQYPAGQQAPRPLPKLGTQAQTFTVQGRIFEWSAHVAVLITAET